MAALPIVRRRVRGLLESSPSFRALPPARRTRIANDTVRVAAYMADPGGLVRLPGPDRQEPPRVVDQDLYERIVYGSGDDAVLSELFGLDTPYSERAQQLRAELVELEVAVIGGTADARAVRRYEVLRALLTSSPVARAREVSARLERDGT